MITQRLILIDPGPGTVGLHYTDTQVWACRGCRSMITGEDGGSIIVHPDDCPETARVVADPPSTPAAEGQEP
jgi:hypothetical protein